MDVPDLVTLVDRFLQQADAGDDRAAGSVLDDISWRLYQVPPGLTLDAGSLAILRERAAGSAGAAKVALDAVAILAAWHQGDGPDTRRPAMAAWIVAAADLADRWSLESDGGAIVGLARTVHALGTLLGPLDAAPRPAASVLARAALALRLRPGADTDALTLTIAAWEWRRATGQPTDDLADTLSMCADAMAGGIAGAPDPRVAAARTLSAFELLGRTMDAQRMRLMLASGLLSEGLGYAAEPLLTLASQPPSWPGQTEHVEVLRIQLLQIQGDLQQAWQRMQVMLDAAPLALREQLVPLAARLLADRGCWAEALQLSAPLVDRVAAQPPAPEPAASAAVDQLAAAARWALEAGDQARFTRLRAAVAAYQPSCRAAEVAGPALDALDAAGRGDLAAAVADLQHALARVRADLESLESAGPRTAGLPGPDRIRRGPLTAQVAWLTARLCDTHQRRDDPRAALVAAEHLRAEFLRAAREPRAPDGQLVPPGAYAGLAGFLDAVTRGLATTRDEPAEAARAATRAAVLDLRRAPLLALLYTPTPTPRDLAGDLAAVLEHAGPDACVVSLNLTDEAVTVLATDGVGYLGERTALPRPGLDREVAALFTRATTTGPQPGGSPWRARAQTCLSALGDLVGAPIRRLTDRLGRGEIVLSATGVLGCLPLAAVGTDLPGTLLDHLAGLCLVPGIGAAAQSLETGRGSRPDVLVSAVIDPSIPMARLEADLVGQAWAAVGRTPTMSVPLTQAAVVERVRSAGIVHLAAHASWNRIRAVDGGIGTADGQIDCGELFRALDVDGADLVVLSACDTAASDLTPGGEAVNMAQLVLCAGARQVVASLWPVEDVATTLLMDHVHRRLAAGEPVGRALLHAQRWLRDLTYAQACDTLTGWVSRGPELVGQRIARWQQMPPDGHPLADPMWWAPFGCYGIPATAQPR